MTLRLFAGLLSILLAASWAAPASAQEIPIFREQIDLDFDRPEAWGMKYFSAAVLPTPRAHDLSRTERTGRVVGLGLEIGWLPELDLEQRTIGFDGIKEEDLNKLDVLPRPSIQFALPAGAILSIGWIPPLEIEGVRANLVSVTASRRLLERSRWDLGGRLVGQTGTIKSDFTCPATTIGHPPGSPRNIWGCEATSSDEYSIDQLAGEIVLARSFQAPGNPRVSLAAGAIWFDGEFQVDAIRSGFRDLTLLRADGTFPTLTVGSEWRLSSSIDLGLVGLWAPIEIRRPGRDVERDPFFNVRLFVSRRL